LQACRDGGGSPMVAGRGKNLTYLRSSNTGSIIKNILVNGSASRLFLSEKLNLTKMSISYLTNELIEKNILYESTNGVNNNPSVYYTNGSGRKVKHLLINPDCLYAIGIYIARNALYFSISNIAGHIIEKIKIMLTNKTVKSYLAEIMVEQVQKLLDGHSEKNILGLGVASIGLVDTKKGALMSSTDFFGIADFNIKEILENKFCLPVFVVEDMKAACLAESFYGAARTFTDFIYCLI